VPSGMWMAADHRSRRTKHPDAEERHRPPETGRSADPRAQGLVAPSFGVEIASRSASQIHGGAGLHRVKTGAAQYLRDFANRSDLRRDQRDFKPAISSVANLKPWTTVSAMSELITEMRAVRARASAARTTPICPVHPRGEWDWRSVIEALGEQATKWVLENESVRDPDAAAGGPRRII